MSISSEVQHQYEMYYNRFLDFCMENGEEVPKDAMTMDAMLADYMDVCFLDKRTPHEGEKTMAAVEYKHLAYKGKLMRSKRAMKGWKKVMPSQSRLPLPKAVAYGIAMQLAAKGQREMALKVVTDFILYLRPGEGASLTGRCVVAPVRSAGVQFKWVTVVVRDFEGLRPDKVGVFDNSIPVDRPADAWIGELLLKKAKSLKDKDHPLYTFTVDEFRNHFIQAGSDLGLQNLHPYQLRHGGATHDLTSKD
jgi:integrase